MSGRKSTKRLKSKSAAAYDAKAALFSAYPDMKTFSRRTDPRVEEIAAALSAMKIPIL